MRDDTTINEASTIILGILKTYLVLNIYSVDTTHTTIDISIEKASKDVESDLQGDLINKVLYYNSEIYDEYAYEYMNESALDYTISETEMMIYINFKVE